MVSARSWSAPSSSSFRTSDRLAMEFTLALELGMPVSRLRRDVSGYEFAQWCAFFTWRHQVRENAARKAGGGAKRGRGGMGRG